MPKYDLENQYQLVPQGPRGLRLWTGYIGTLTQAYRWKIVHNIRRNLGIGVNAAVDLVMNYPVEAMGALTGIISEEVIHGYQWYRGRMTPLPDPVEAPPPTSRPVKKESMARGKRKYFTQGLYQGNIGKYTKRKGKKKGIYKTNLVERYEHKGTVTDPHLVYIGMGLNYDKIVLGIFRQVIRCVLAKAGIFFTNWDEVLTGVHNFQIQFYEQMNDLAPKAASTSMVATASPSTYATNLRDAYASADTNTQVSHMLNCRMYDSASQLAEIDLRCLKIQVSCSQAMLVQNQTLAPNAGTGQDDSSAFNITNNPLSGRMFYKNGNIILAKDRGSASTTNFKPFGTYGVNFPEYFAYPGANQWNQTQYNVGNVFARCKPKTKVIMQPGAMHKFSQYNSKTLYINQWKMLLWDHFHQDSPGSINKYTFGTITMLALEKMLDSSDETENIKCGFELNQVTRYGYKYVKSKQTLPIFTQD